MNKPHDFMYINMDGNEKMFSFPFSFLFKHMIFFLSFFFFPEHFQKLEDEEDAL